MIIQKYLCAYICLDNMNNKYSKKSIIKYTFHIYLYSITPFLNILNLVKMYN